MTLKQQFQVFIGTIIITFFACFLYSIFNRLFYKKHSSIVRLLFETIFFIAIFYGYFRFLAFACHGILNIHYLLASLIGGTFYYSFYAYYVNRFIEKNAIIINKKFLSPIIMKISSFRAIIKKKVRGKKNVQKQASGS